MKTRYLLFDSGCAVCSGVAYDVEKASNGWLTAKSLRDAEMKAILDNVRPGWKWEPTLIEIDENATKVFTGIHLRIQIILGVGLGRAWQIANIVSSHTQQAHRNMPRRSFLQRSAIFAGVLFGATVAGQGTALAAVPCSAASCNCFAVSLLYRDCSPCNANCSCGLGCAVIGYTRTYYQCCPPYNPGQMCGYTSYASHTAICCG